MALALVRAGDCIVPLFDDLLPDGKGLLVMLSAYLDRGDKRDSADGVMSVACAVFKPTPYKQFIRPWNRMLKSWGASAFHSTDFYCGAQAFKRSTPERQQMFERDSRAIPQLVGEKVERIMVVAFRPEEFNEVASPAWKAAFGTSVHCHAVQLCLLANGFWRSQKCSGESFAYVMESGDVDEGEILKMQARIRQSPEMAKSLKIVSFTTVAKGSARGLEAADFVAWQWNKHYMDKIRMGRGKNPRKDLLALALASRRKCDHIFATGEKLKSLFALVPAEVLEGPTNKTKQSK